jgi:predicted PurR-regulated permease PerM
MIMPKRIQMSLIAWPVGLIAFLILFVWLFNDVLAPFVLGAGIAYLLNPLVEKLQYKKLPRWVAVAFILGLFFLILGVALLAAVPFLYGEASRFVQSLPDLYMRIQEAAHPYIESARKAFGLSNSEAFLETAKGQVGQAAKIGGGTLKSLTAFVGNSGKALLHTVSFIVLMPIVAFFMMKEWPNITTWIDTLIPRPWYITVHDLLHKMNVKLAGFIRGQILVMGCLGSFYAIGLGMAGLNFGILIGMMAGLLSVIPFVGSFTGLLTAIIMAWAQSGGDIGYILGIAGIFFLGQFLEGNFITPKLVGESVGLHPLWILFGIAAGGSLFGLTGMLLAVPTVAVSSVLITFALDAYKNSRFYGHVSDTQNP